MQLSLALGVDWSDWVIRLPRAGGGAGAIFVLLFVALIAYALLIGASSVVGKIMPIVWSLVTFFAFIAVIVAVARFQDDEPGGATVEPETEEECAEELLSRCPPAAETGSG